jgi:hypothetical protein
LAREVVEMLLHRQRQEGTKDMPADGGVGGMEDRPLAHDRLGSAEEVLDLEQIAVAQDRLIRLPATDSAPSASWWRTAAPSRLFSTIWT